MAARGSVTDFIISPKRIDSLPAHKAEALPASPAPFLFAIPRNAQTLFLCWDVDWPNVFAGELPVNREVYVRLTSRGGEQMHRIEPLHGSCSIGDLHPGERYQAELGFYAPAEEWHRVLAASPVVMPAATADDSDAPIDVATIPFHLAFERLIKIASIENRSDLARALGSREERAAAQSPRDAEDERTMRELQLSDEQLQEVAAIRERLTRTQRRTVRVMNFGSSWPQNSGS